MRLHAASGDSETGSDSSSDDEGFPIDGLDKRKSYLVHEAHERACIAREQASVDISGNPLHKTFPAVPCRGQCDGNCGTKTRKPHVVNPNSGQFSEGVTRRRLALLELRSKEFETDQE